MYLDIVGPQRVAALVSDQASNMRAARAIVTSRDGYKHILSIRYANDHSWWLVDSLQHVLSCSA